ncbi:MAG TPA: hypothetical protein VFB82_07270 [Blastocatellia bacterium]|nr:hypothetical protein [Blastocatellia bacterium]
MNSIDQRLRTVMARLGVALTVLIALVTVAFAQDPAQALPQAYKLKFENDWVKVTRVHYAPKEKLPSHPHTQTASAYVYLNDSGPVVFKHIGLDYGAITRPPTKAGSFRLYRGLKEMHEVENNSDLPSDFLRVEFKTEPVGDKNLRGRFFREEYPAGENFEKVQFENEQVRITRLVVAPGKSLPIATTPTEPALLVALTRSEFKLQESKNKRSTLKLEMGDSGWIDAGQQKGFENRGSAPAEMLRFDFKTKPLSKELLEKDKKHEHPKK